MTIKKNRLHNISVITGAILIALFIIWMPRQKQSAQNLACRVFYSVKGWGYDILVNNKIVIHQDIVPAIVAQRAFTTREQAEKAAGLVVQKIKSGKAPSLSVSDIQSIFAETEMK